MEKTMIISASFIGTNSLGYEYGKNYILRVSNKKQIIIKRIDNTGLCKYNSLYTFLQNWNNIQIKNIIS